jgi:hypothetical protein
MHAPSSHHLQAGQKAADAQQYAADSSEYAKQKAGETAAKARKSTEGAQHEAGKAYNKVWLPCCCLFSCNRQRSILLSVPAIVLQFPFTCLLMQLACRRA